MYLISLSGCGHENITQIGEKQTNRNRVTVPAKLSRSRSRRPPDRCPNIYTHTWLGTSAKVLATFFPLNCLLSSGFPSHYLFIWVCGCRPPNVKWELQKARYGAWKMARLLHWLPTRWRKNDVVYIIRSIYIIIYNIRIIVMNIWRNSSYMARVSKVLSYFTLYFIYFPINLRPWHLLESITDRAPGWSRKGRSIFRCHRICPYII